MTFTVSIAGEIGRFRDLAKAGGAAPGGPGRQSYMDTSRNDCFGTATPATSKVWFTVADGVLSDVYSPTIENTNNGTLQYIVTDGHSFADLQQRDMTYTVSSPDPSGMVCQVTSTDAAHGFRLVTDYITDPGRDSVVRILMVVDLPAPFGPRSANMVPRGTDKFSPSSARTAL